MKRILIAASVALVTVSGAKAADWLPAHTPKHREPCSVYDWTGFYVGGNVGYGWGGNTDPSLSLVNPEMPETSRPISPQASPASAVATNSRTSTRMACSEVCRAVTTGNLAPGYWV